MHIVQKHKKIIVKFLKNIHKRCVALVSEQLRYASTYDYAVDYKSPCIHLCMLAKQKFKAHGRGVASVLASESVGGGFESHRGHFTFVFLNAPWLDCPGGETGGNVLLACCWLGLQELGQWAFVGLSPVVTGPLLVRQSNKILCIFFWNVEMAFHLN